jgi:hypothetical protein
MISYNDKGFSEAGGAVSCVCLICGNMFYRKLNEIYDKMSNKNSRFTETYINKQIEKKTFNKLIVNNDKDAKAIKIYICNKCIFNHKLFG